jgi:hypothetical protein
MKSKSNMAVKSTTVRSLGFHGSGCSDSDLLGCDTVQSYRYIPVFQRNILLPSSEFVCVWLRCKQLMYEKVITDRCSRGERLRPELEGLVDRLLTP